MNKLLIFSFLLSIPLFSEGQSNRIGLSAEYHMLGSDLKWIYKNVPGIQINYARVKEKNHGKKFSSLGVSLGYTKLTPKEDTLYYLVEMAVDDIGYGTAIYDDYHIGQIVATGRWENQIFTNLFLQYGLDFGYYYVAYSYDISDEIISVHGSVIEGKLAIAPTIGLVFKIGNRINLTPYFKYNFYISMGDSDPSSISYNPDVGAHDYFYTPGFSIHYNF